MPPAPIAHVALRNLETGALVADVAMLIDSGADITLVPRASADRLGVAVSAGAAYELIAFDGTRSVATSVKLDLHFLNRAFSGRFLLVDQDHGILGRDVLNHLRLLLDGPRSTWTESV